MSPSLSCRVRYRLCTSLVMLVICVRCRLCTTLVALVTQEHHCIPTQQVQVTANGRCMPFGQLRQGPFRAPVLNKVVALKPVQCYGSRCKHMTVYSRAKVGFSEHKSPTSICGGLMLPHPPPPQGGVQHSRSTIKLRKQLRPSDTLTEGQAHSATTQQAHAPTVYQIHERDYNTYLSLRFFG